MFEAVDIQLCPLLYDIQRFQTEQSLACIVLLLNTEYDLSF